MSSKVQRKQLREQRRRVREMREQRNKSTGWEVKQSK